MINFRNEENKRNNQLATSVLNQYQSGESIEITDLTGAISELLRKYHNQKCDNSSWITDSEIKELKELLHVLVKGIEESENI